MKDREGESEEGMRWRGIQRGACCQTFTTPSLLKQCKERAGPLPVQRGTHTKAATNICAQARQSGCVVDLQPSGIDEVRIFFSPLPPAQFEAGVGGVNLQWNGRGLAHPLPPSTKRR